MQYDDFKNNMDAVVATDFSFFFYTATFKCLSKHQQLCLCAYKVVIQMPKSERYASIRCLVLLARVKSIVLVN